MPRSVAKYIRKEKARIRKTVPDSGERETRIKALYEQFAAHITLPKKRDE
jgi:hypothetical protein